MHFFQNRLISTSHSNVGGRAGKRGQLTHICHRTQYTTGIDAKSDYNVYAPFNCI